MENALSSLALDLSHDGISLHRLESGTWIALDNIPLQVGTLKANMAHLRSLAESTNGKVLVWMPTEQIHTQWLEIAGKPKAEQSKAIESAFAATEGLNADGLDYATGQMDTSGLSPVAVISSEVLAEASEFLHDHGFAATAFSTRTPLNEFGAKPVFKQTRKAGLLASPLLAAAAGIALAIGFGGVVWNSLDLFRPAHTPDFDIVTRLTAPDQEGAPKLHTDTGPPAVTTETINADAPVVSPGIENDFAAFYAFPEDENSIQISVRPSPPSDAPERNDILPGPGSTITPPPVIAALDSGQTGDTIPNIFTSLLVENIEPLASPDTSDPLDLTTPVYGSPATRSEAPVSLYVKAPQTGSASFTVPLELPRVAPVRESLDLSQPPEYYPVYLPISRLDDTPGQFPAAGALVRAQDTADLIPTADNFPTLPAGQGFVDTVSFDENDTPPVISRLAAAPLPLALAGVGFASETPAEGDVVPYWAESLPPPADETVDSVAEVTPATDEGETAELETALANQAEQSLSEANATEPLSEEASLNDKLSETDDQASAPVGLAPEATTEIDEIAKAIEEIEFASLDAGVRNPVPVYGTTPELVPPNREWDAAILDPSSVADTPPGETATTADDNRPVPDEEETKTTEAEQDAEGGKIAVFTTVPPIVPPPRPFTEDAETPPDEDADVVAALIEEALQETPETATVVDNMRPVLRPEGLAPLPVVTTTPADAPIRSRYALNVSERPANRPSNFATRVVRVATAPATERATAAPVPAAPAAPKVQLPTSASVQQAATSERAINLRNVNLIGVSGSDGRRTALIRMPNGKIVSVNTGDKFSGYQVAAIGRNAVRIRKNGRDTVLEIPD